VQKFVQPLCSAVSSGGVRLRLCACAEEVIENEGPP